MLERKSDRAPHALRMRHLRLIHGKTLEECGSHLGVQYSTYAGFERNEIRFRRRDLIALAHLYGMTLEDAFPGLEAPTVSV